MLSQPNVNLVITQTDPPLQQTRVYDYLSSFFSPLLMEGQKKKKKNERKQKVTGRSSRPSQVSWPPPLSLSNPPIKRFQVWSMGVIMKNVNDKRFFPTTS